MSADSSPRARNISMHCRSRNGSPSRCRCSPLRRPRHGMADGFNVTAEVPLKNSVPTSHFSGDPTSDHRVRSRRGAVRYARGTAHVPHTDFGRLQESRAAKTVSRNLRIRTPTDRTSARRKSSASRACCVRSAIPCDSTARGLDLEPHRRPDPSNASRGRSHRGRNAARRARLHHRHQARPSST
jgi:hypothetical protein